MPPADSASPDLFELGGELGARIREHDWSRTALGPLAQWPQSLRTAVGIMLGARQPIWIGWGEELLYLYNDPYKSIIGGKHPWALGRPTREVWSEIWSEIGPMLATAQRGEQGTYVESQLLIMERNGYPEETYYTFSYTLIPAEDGSIGGIICANTDDTRRVIGERQLALLRVGSFIDQDQRADLVRVFEALMTERIVGSHDHNDVQTRQVHVTVLTLIDMPGHDRITTGKSHLAISEARTGIHLARTRFQVHAFEFGGAGQNRREQPNGN